MRAIVRIRRLSRWVAAALESPWARTAARVARWTVPFLLIAYLCWRLTQLGWTEVWNARPVAFGFYAVVLLQYYVQPVADLIIYRSLLVPLPLFVQLRKRCMNYFLDYSGELYFFLWARKNLALQQRLLFHAIKDSNVLSAASGFVMVWLTLLAVVLGGGVKLPSLGGDRLWTLLSAGSIPLVLAMALFVGGRKVTMLSRAKMLSTFGIHLVRGIVQLSLDFVVFWLSGALGSVTACLQFVALRVLVTRLPLVVNKDLIFVGVGIAAAGALDASAPRIAAMLVLMTALELAQNLVLVGLPWVYEQFGHRGKAGAGAT